MKKIVVRALPLVLACCYLTPVRAASIDPVLYWNGVAAAAFTAAISPAPAGTPTPLPPIRPGQVGALDFAMVHVAVHDAVQAYESGSSRTQVRSLERQDLRRRPSPLRRTTCS